MAEDELFESDRIRPGEISVPRGLFTRRNRSESSRRRPVDEILNAVEGESDALRSFKVAIPCCRTSTSLRPVPTCCNLCFPEIRKTVNAKYMTLGVRNSVNCRSENNANNWLVKKCLHLHFFWRKTELFSKYKVISVEELVEDAHFILSLENHEEELKRKNSGPDTGNLKARVECILRSIGVSSGGESLVSLARRIGGWIASQLTMLSFEAVCVHDGQLNLLKYIHGVHPFIYVPLQKSNWDHFILSWVLLESDIPPPLLIARRSLIFDSLLGPISKLTGCLGRRRSVQLMEKDKDAVSDIVVEGYLKSMLKAGKSIELALEQHRSRNGYPGTVYAGTELFNLISTCIRENEIDEAFIVPVNISYEKLPENEIIGNYEKLQHSNIFTKLWRLLRRRLGFVRVNFGHPISFREYQNCVLTPSKMEQLIANNKRDQHFWLTDGYCNNLSSKDLNWNDDAGSVTSLSSLYEHMDIGTSNEISTLFADSLACHTIYDAMKCHVFMSTNIVSFLLMAKYRHHGVELKVLEGDVEDLVQLLHDRKRDVGFSSRCDFAVVVDRAIMQLGSDLVQKTKRDGCCFISPVNLPSSLIELSYYGNPLIAFFAMEGIIVTALFALHWKKFSIYNGSRVKIFVQEEELIEKAKQLAVLLKAQFILSPPCQQLGEAIKCGIDAIRDEYLIFHEVRKVYHHDEDLDDWDTGGGGDDFAYSSERLEIRALEEPVVYQRLHTVRGLIVPYLQAYAEAITVLHCLLHSENVREYMPEMVIRQRMLNQLLVNREIPPELVVMDTIKNFLVAIKHLQIIGETVNEDTGKIMLFLKDEYSKAVDLELVRNNILYFCSF